MSGEGCGELGDSHTWSWNSRTYASVSFTSTCQALAGPGELSFLNGGEKIKTQLKPPPQSRLLFPRVRPPHGERGARMRGDAAAPGGGACPAL